MNGGRMQENTSLYLWILEPVLRILEVYPRSRILIFTHLGSRIQDPKTAKKERGNKNFIPFCSNEFHKIVNYFIFEMLKKKIWSNFQRIKELFTPKIVTKPSKIWVWDPGSEIRDPEKTYSGSRGQKGIGSRIWIPNID
jgi:hypothetical protein